MNLAQRIRSLERRRHGKCSICGGQGRLVITSESAWWGNPTNPPLVGCEGCGEIMHIKIVELSHDEVLKRHQERIAGGKP